MKSVAELSHYEVLEIPADAGAEEIERAYRLACATWAEDSLAAYGLYESRESEGIRERVEAAYRVLCDPEARQAYDESLGEEGRSESEDLHIALSLARERDDTGSAASPAPAQVASLDVFVDENEDAPFDGSRLRRARLQRGVELEQIAEVTKVSPAYLRFIEEERFEDLPAPVYVRGFVTAYARYLGLDPQRVAPSYLERLQAQRPVEPPVPRSRRRRRRLL